MYYLPSLASSLFIISSLIFSLVGKSDAQTDPNQPNILLIIADDMGTDAMNGYHNNNALPTTPTLDSLREHGITFKNAMSNPICSPTRASILSGKYGIKNCVQTVGENFDTTHISLFEAVEDQTSGAYDDAIFGKWHLSDPVNLDHPSEHGVDHFEGIIGGGVGNSYYSWNKTLNGSQSTINEYATEHLTTAAINWITSRNKPWITIMAHPSPHTPFHEPPAGTFTQAPLNNNRQKFLAMIENLDYETNRLLNAIDPAVLNNTTIIFIGDNGTQGSIIRDYASDHGKGTLYEGGTRVPFVVSGKGVSRLDEEEDGLVHVADLYATILEIVGASLPGGVYNSYSFIDALIDPSADLKKYNYADLEAENESDFAIRNNAYKLIEFVDGSQEFYDMIDDTLELTNLIGSLTTAQEAIKLELENEAHQIRSSWSCNDGIENGDETSIDCGANGCFNCSVSQLPCIQDTLITCEDIILDSSVVATHLIESSHVVSSQNARFWAEDCIELKGGFEFSGEELTIEIKDNCIVTGIEDAQCSNSNATSTTNIGCCATPSLTSEYDETVSGTIRTIVTNNYPNHEYCLSNGTLTPISRTFTISTEPTLNATKESILDKNYRPRTFYGVALNGVIFAPAPAQPFIFENTSTGEYNWDWVFEPTNVQGNGQGFVKLDCASGHAGNQGYHYHGNMFQYVEEVVQPGISTTSTPPSDPILIGWAADGFPIIYRFGPDENGDLELLKPSYQLKYGNRPGDGVSEPCGSYNGRYTKDYEYISCSGDLDECNGIERSITITTAQGTETFDYFYMVTDDFPQVGRCFSGTSDNSFSN